MAVAESPQPTSPASMLTPGAGDDEAMRASVELAWQLQREEEERIRQQVEMLASPQTNEDEDAESIALAIRLQQEDDDAALRAALGPEAQDRGSPSNYSYEDLLRLSDTVGTVSRGASKDSIASLRTLTAREAAEDSTVILGEQCSICRMEWEDDDELRVLPCGHAEHCECLEQWLGVNKCCPVCMTEVPA